MSKQTIRKILDAYVARYTLKAKTVDEAIGLSHLITWVGELKVEMGNRLIDFDPDNPSDPWEADDE